MKKITVLLLILLFTTPMSSAGDLNGSFTNMDGDQEAFSNYLGKPILVEAFSTECSHCIDQHPELAEFYDEYETSIELISLTINPDDSLNVLKDFNSSYNTDWVMGIDEDFQFKNQFNVMGTPTTVFFDETGVFVNCFVGTHTYAELDFEMKAYMDDPQTYKDNNPNEGICPDIESGGINIITLGIYLVGAFLIFSIIRDIQKRRN